MAIVSDPDNLDRWQVLVDPVLKTISIRGLGTSRHAADTTGETDVNGDFSDAGANFTTDSVVAGDILTIFSDPSNDGGIIGHYVVNSIIDNSGLKVDRPITQSSASDLDYRVDAPEAQGGTPEAVADGITMQAIYSFLKEEWRTKSGPTGGEDLIKYPFPMVSITSEQFEIGGVNNSNWEFADNSGDGANADESPRNLVRTGGWQSINNSGEVINDYPSIVTLGALDSDAQVYYQLTSATTNPTDFVLTGAVNQSIKTLEVTGGASADGLKVPTNRVTGDITFSTGANEDIVDEAGGNFGTSNYVAGQKVQVRRAAGATNNGIFTIASLETTSSTNDTLRLSGVTLTAESNSATAILSPITDNRDYLVLRVRKKARSYAQSEIADIGVTTINTIVNRFPLAHIEDPAIVLDDGAMNGDGTNTAFRATVTVNSASDGDALDADTTDGTWEFSSASATWNTGGEGSELYVGDTIEITGPASNPNIGVYQVSAVNSDTSVDLIIEPGRTVDTATDDGVLEYTARTRVLVEELTNGATADSATAGQGTFTSAGQTFQTKGVAANDILRVKSGTAAVEGVYKVVSVTNETTLEVDTNGGVTDTTIYGDQDDWPSESTLTYDVLEPGMHLQYKSVNSSSLTAGTDITSLIFGNATNTIQLDDPTNEDWDTDYDYHVGGTLTISGANTTAHDGQYVITAISTTTTTDDTVTVINADGTTPSFTSDTDTGVTVTGTYGFIRNLNSVEYSFNWRLFGNGGTLAECFQFLQRQLRLTSDIDEGDGTSRGDITDLLMNYTAPNGTTLNLFIDDVDNTEFNNLTQQDLTGNSRNFAFLAGLTVTLNSNILNANTNKIVVFFTDPAAGADEFGTPGAIIVDDKDGVDMSATDVTSSPLTFTFDYTNNAQGSRTPNTPADITVVCITDDTGQYVSATNTINEVNNTTVALVAGLERNYSNPA